MPNSYGLWSGTYHFLWGEHCDSLWITSCSCRGFAPGCVHCFEARSTSVDFKETDQKVPTCMIVLILWMVHDGSIVGRCCDETWWASQWPTSSLLAHWPWKISVAERLRILSVCVCAGLVSFEANSNRFLLRTADHRSQNEPDTWLRRWKTRAGAIAASRGMRGGFQHVRVHLDRRGSKRVPRKADVNPCLDTGKQT